MNSDINKNINNPKILNKDEYFYQKLTKKYIVVKRDGSQEFFDINKIRKVIDWAVQGLDVDPLKVKLDIGIILKDGITTKEIQQVAIMSALKLTSVTEPDWKYVAGRLKLFDMYKDILISRGYTCKRVSQVYNNFLDFLKVSVKNKIYTKILLEKYTDEEIIIASGYINQSYDLFYDYAGVNLLAKRYLVEYKDKIWELPQQMFLVIALLVEQNANKKDRLEQVRNTYEKIANRKVSLATPLLMNLRKPEGNLSSCFITAMDDSRESIFYTLDQIAAISKNGGGVGCNVSSIRCKGSRIKDIKNSSGGVVPWIRLINDTAIAVNQQGKRQGAVTVSLDVWHLDIEDFLELQTENGDQRMKAYDIFPQVIIPDLFMERVEQNKGWLLVDPHEIEKKYNKKIVELWGQKFTQFYKIIERDAKEGKLELFKFVKAKEILKKIMKSQIETGMPYIAFKDTLNRYNPNKHDGLIMGTNLCTESHSNIKPSIVEKRKLKDGMFLQTSEDGLVHVCNLVSINLSTICSDEELKESCQIAVRLLDNAIDFTDVPIPEGIVHNKRYRTIGVGAMGLADYLAKNNIPYIKSALFVDKLFEKFALYCISASIDLAKERGAFEVYKGSDWDNGIILGHDKKWFKENSELYEQWENVFANLAKYKIRNSQITAIAPNTSSSLIQGCSPSVLPIFSKFYIDTHKKGSVPNCPPFIKEKFWYYDENKNVNQKIVVDVVSHINKWIDTGVSMELLYNLNRDIRAKDIYDTIMLAWKKDIKTIYYTRSIQKDGNITDKSECVSCAG